MKLLVTGAKGFVGSHVVEQAEKRGWRVFGVEIDAAEFPDETVDVVVSLAAIADPTLALKSPHFTYHNNVGVMLDTLDYAERTGARILHVSSNEVYGTTPSRYISPIYEPHGPYAGAKACQEIICRAQSEVPVTIVVTQSLFGERQQRDKLVPTAIRSLLAGTPVTLQGDGNKWAERPFLYVGDLVQMLLECASGQHDEGWNGGGRYHIGATDWVSVKRVVDTLAEGLGVEPKVEQVPFGDRAGHELRVPLIGWEWDGEPTDALGVLPELACWYRDHPEWL